LRGNEKWEEKNSKYQSWEGLEDKRGEVENGEGEGVGVGLLL